MSLGSVWTDGYQVAAHDPSLQPFDRSVEVQPATVSELTLASGNVGPGMAGRPEPIDGPVLPFRVHRFESRGADLRLVAVRLGDDPLGLLIPVATLLQFYLGTSTLVAQAAINGGFARRPSDVYDLAASGWVDRERRVFRLRLRYPLDAGDAHVVARFAADEAGGPARRMYARVHASIVKSWVNGEPLLPSFGFPFHGKTRLKALGRRFQVDTPAGRRERFLALQLLQCSAAFPYRTLELELPGRSGDREDEDGDLRTIPWIKAVPELDASLTTDRRADSALGDLRLQDGRCSERFTALREIRVVENRVPAAAAARACRVVAEGAPTSLFTTGPLQCEGSGAGRVRQAMEAEPADRSAEEAPPAGDAPSYLSAGGAMFAELIAAFGDKGLEGFAAQPLAIGDEAVTVQGHAYTAMPSVPGGTWHNLPSGRPRALFGTVISWPGGSAYLFDIERDEHEKATSSMMLALAPNARPLRSHELHRVKEIARRHRRLWGAAASGGIRNEVDGALPSVTFHAIAHRGTRAAEYAEEAVREIRRASAGAAFPETGLGDAAGSRPREAGGGR
ncbi:MAG TPA: hypothetical protein VED40_23370 [Azospirillaceae bacterium]|nr:hypothetical protein [Azospirillaceae bacterium]